MTSKSLSLSLLCMIPFLGITQPAIITAPSAQEYLGQFQYFRTWTDKRRLIVVHGKDADMDRMLQDAIYQYRCDLATRNINIVTLGETKGLETIFYHSEDNRRDFVQTNDLEPRLRRDLLSYFHTLYRDLPLHNHWCLLIGYDGGRKRMYRKVKFVSIFDKIDSMPMRQREMEQQRKKMITCNGI
ncbi:coiled-coil domain-containing protein 80-like [Tigriopus californicus]|uniref:coiled-coil domain-containing protein 80-like n=1 Tax=Tigriopus californicus TaxID=6832 RepID=UPI0027D9E9E3|nr:coiled-coil domain-containing protein 80-like [Tigriopus californicus]XP_059095802.1 coiled-coil domain-containing protein 80-like [Tigriopus californicus]